MNARLRHLQDGSGADGREVVFDYFVTSVAGGIRPRTNVGEMYWPFALAFQVTKDAYDVIHLPSGYSVVLSVPKRRARSLVRALRASGANWEFTRPKGRRWEAARRVAQSILRRYQ